MPRTKTTKPTRAKTTAAAQRPKSQAKPPTKPAATNAETKLARDLLAAINASELSRYEIARRAGLSESALSYFVSGRRSLSLESAGKVADVLGLELRQTKHGAS